jgi:ribose 5-phosphate isomerase A
MPQPGADELKREVGRRAAELVRSGMSVGLGTGSTARHLIERLGERVREGLRFRAVSTSTATTEAAERLGIPLFALEECAPLDLAIDGADQVDRQGDLIKGLGGALLREKRVARAAREFVVIVDSGKLVERLGEGCPVPVEVDPSAWRDVQGRLEGLGAVATLRRRSGRPYVTDNGNRILDAEFGPIESARELEQALNRLPGVLENGVFSGLAARVLIGEPAGVREWTPPRSRGAESAEG